MHRDRVRVKVNPYGLTKDVQPIITKIDEQLDCHGP